jgi:ubiquinone/menaquinone biosynthesis C-methylase UbiE
VKARTTIVAIAGAVLALAWLVAAWVARERRNPSPLSYGQRFFLDLPRPFLRTAELRRLLVPAPGQRLLEVGPGTGFYALDVACWIAPAGRLDVLDVQQAMLIETMRRADQRGLANIVPTRGDARALPYPDAAFDAAYLTGVLGEVPDKDAALREVRRVLKPGGRLVVGESQPDPHMVPLAWLRERAAAVGLHFERSTGGRLGYFASFRAG